MASSEKQRQKKPEAVDSADQFSVEVGKRLVEARIGLGLSQQVVHNRTKMTDPEGVGVSRAALSLYETGVNRPGAREIRILCETLKITPNWLLFGTESPAKVLQPSLDFLRGSEVTVSVRLAYAMLALDPVEREAIASLVLSLIGKKLSDVQISGLLTMASMIADKLNEEILETLGADAKKLPLVKVIEKYVSEMTDGIYSTWGTVRPGVPDDEEFDPDNPPPPRNLKQSDET